MVATRCLPPVKVHEPVDDFVIHRAQRTLAATDRRRLGAGTGGLHPLHPAEAGSVTRAGVPAEARPPSEARRIGTAHVAASTVSNIAPRLGAAEDPTRST